MRKKKLRVWHIQECWRRYKIPDAERNLLAYSRDEARSIYEQRYHKYDGTTHSKSRLMIKMISDHPECEWVGDPYTPLQLPEQKEE